MENLIVTLDSNEARIIEENAEKIIFHEMKP